jgi:hypothetical protein
MERYINFGKEIRMDEQTFLEKYQMWCYNEYNPQATDVETFKKIIKESARSFLIEHHKEYGKVWWYKHTPSVKEQIKEQIRINLNDFLNFLPFELDAEYKEIIINSYIEQRGT